MSVIDSILSGELERQYAKLNELEVGSEEYEKVANTITKLTDRSIEFEKVNLEREKFNSENENKQKQMKEERVDRIVKNGLTAAGIILPLGVTIWGTLVSIKFEDEHSFTTIMGRGFINKLLPKK